MEAHDREAVVLIGASRIQEDIDSVAFAGSFQGRPPRQLAIPGSCCIPILRDFSQDEAFVGILICDLFPNVYEAGSQNDPVSRDYVHNYRNRSAVSGLEYQFQTIVQSRVAFRAPELAPDTVLARMRNGRRPAQPPEELQPDRSVHGHYAAANVPPRTSYWIEDLHSKGKGLTSEGLEQLLPDLKEMVGRIKQRGGKVILVYLPTSGFVRNVEEREFPRREYWDVLVAGLGVTAIHFADYPELDRFDCPDGHHLDHADAIEFTKSFASILRQKLSARPAPGPG